MRYSLLLILVSYAPAVFSQQFSYRHYDGKDGLAGSVVYCAAEDKEGFLWFGTETGISRFDGTGFRNFTTADGLPDNEVLKLFVDSRNRVWMIPFSNSLCYYWKGKIYNHDNDSMLRQLSFQSDPFSITEDKYGNIIIQELSALHILCPDKRVSFINVVGGSPFSMEAGGLTRDSLFTFLANVNEMFDTYVLPDPEKSAPVPVKKTLLHVDKGSSINTSLVFHEVIVSVSNNRIFFLSADNKMVTLPLPRDLLSISKLDDSLFALNCRWGTTIYNLSAKRKLADFLEGQAVNAVIRDSEGNLWFMCAGSGIFRLASMAYKNFEPTENGSSLSVSSIQKVDSLIYVGTEKSFLWIIDPRSGKIRRQFIKGGAPNQGRILAIRPAGKNIVLLGTDGGIVQLTNFRKCREMTAYSIKSITRDREDNLLVSAAQGVLTVRPSDLKELDQPWRTRSTCSAMIDTLIYVGTISGLYTVSPNRQICFLGNVDPVFKRRIADIKQGNDGIIWIATNGGGVAGYKKGRVLYLLTDKDGLTSNICRNIAVSDSDIWVGTDKGLNRISRQQGHFVVTKFTSADGLGSDIINTVCVDKKNVYVGTARGLTWFDADKIASSSYCRLRITAVKTTDHTWAYDTSNLVLPHRENSMRVEFVGISYRSAGDITYSYRLRGLDKVWKTTRETVLSYPTLPSGIYELDITATNKFGVQSDPVRINFTVEKLLWEKTWFLVLTGVMVSALIWFFVGIRIRRLKREAQEKLNTNKRMAALEQMALKAQMNPHFIFNSLNSIQQYVIDKDFKGVNKFISAFSRLIRLTLEMSSNTVVSIDEELKYISTYLELERTRFENKFSYYIRVDPAIDRFANYIPPMILQPYIENSIRHGVRNRDDEEGKITVDFAINDQYLVTTIDDNGVGRKAAQKYKSRVPVEYQSRGMLLTASRIEMFNKINLTSILIHIEDRETPEGLPAGTRVTICFPRQEVIKPKSLYYDQSSNY